MLADTIPPRLNQMKLARTTRLGSLGSLQRILLDDLLWVHPVHDELNSTKSQNIDENDGKSKEILPLNDPRP